MQSSENDDSSLAADDLRSQCVPLLSERSALPLPTRRIVVGECAASSSALLVQTLLGSCVAVCLHDPVAGIGGMNHILLPDGGWKMHGKTASGGRTMRALIDAMVRLGADRRRVVAKCFGAGNILECIAPPTVGDVNAEFVRSFLKRERIPILSERLGGVQAIQVSFQTDTGRAVVRSVGGLPLR